MIPAQQPQEAPHRPAQTAPQPQQQRDNRGKTDKKQANHPATTSGQSQHTPARSEKKEQATTPEQKPITLTAQDGDSQSLMARRFIKSHHQAQQLNPAAGCICRESLGSLDGAA